jgi:molecular chaperone GrpE (heat shock protein)
LEVLDLLKSAQKHLNDEGLELVIKKFLDILRLEGVEKIETKNSNFDPGLMECVEVVEGESDNCVAEELSEGYVFQEYLLRPARVKVYKKAEKENNN